MTTPLDTRTEPPKIFRWIVLLFASLSMFGNYYIYDSINPLVDIFIQQLGFTNENVGWLNSSYSIAAVLTLIIGGIVVDRIGTKKSMFVFSALCLVGAALMVFEGNFWLMIAGRTILGLGAESLIVAVTTALAKWFKGKELSFAFGINLTIARLASVAADNSPSWASWAFYPGGTHADPSWRGPLMIAVGAGVICVAASMVYWWLENVAEKRYTLGAAGQTDKLEFSSMFKFGKSYWLIVGLCFTFYSAIFPFRTFAIKFFMDTHFIGVEEELARSSAGFFNSLLPMSAMFVTPLFGLIADKFGKRALLMMFGSLLLVPVYLIMAYTGITLWLPVTMMGIAFSLIPAVMWPSVAYIVEEKRLGTAYALMTLIQQIGFFAFNLAIGMANDFSKADSTNPQGYALGMWLFSTLGFLGLLFAFLLRKNETGPNAHGLETITMK
ncbi:MFS transporter [bacterium]|nr:MFS transporter [bacterium]